MRRVSSVPSNGYGRGSVTEDVLLQAALRKATESARVKTSFVETMGPRLARAVIDVAARLKAGARVFTMGNGGSACDAQHLAVELMHPVIEKRPAYPAIALAADAALLSAVANDQDFSLAFADQIRLLAKPGDVAVGIATSGDSANVCRGLVAARETGALTIAITGRDGGRMVDLAEHTLIVPSYNIHRIQEAHTFILHVLWDLVQVELGAEDVL
jgi:D-sedoheptulose 7-phosphate isomerase